MPILLSDVVVLQYIARHCSILFRAPPNSNVDSLMMPFTSLKGTCFNSFFSDSFASSINSSTSIIYSQLNASTKVNIPALYSPDVSLIFSLIID